MDPRCQRGAGLRVEDAPLSPEPTAAEPGTEAKVKVLQERAGHRQQLFHPDDAHLADWWDLVRALAARGPGRPPGHEGDEAVEPRPSRVLHCGLAVGREADD
jgi:hypothetical protein